MKEQEGSWFLTHQCAQDPRERCVKWPELSRSTKHRSSFSGCFCGIGRKFTHPGEDGVSERLDGGKEQGKGREERKQNVAVECRFKYITKD